MSNRKTTQHRAKRDTSNKEKAELKRTISHLKRQVARLEKEVEKGVLIKDEEQIQEIIELQKELDAEAPTVLPTEDACPLCNSTDLGRYTTPMGKTLMGCKSCKKWKKAV